MALTLLSGCALFDQPGAKVRVTVSTPISVRLGDSVAVRVSILNMSDAPITYQGNLCPRLFRVVNHKDEDTGPPYRTIACPAVSIERTLKPTEQNEYVAYWQAHTHGPRFEPIVVEPGHYRVEPVIAIAEHSGHRRVDVQTVKAIITVVQ